MENEIFNQPNTCSISTADAAWAISYITDEDGDRIQAVLDAGCVPSLVTLLNHSENAIVVPALRSVGNIVTGSDSQVSRFSVHFSTFPTNGMVLFIIYFSPLNRFAWFHRPMPFSMLAHWNICENCCTAHGTTSSKRRHGPSATSLPAIQVKFNVSSKKACSSISAKFCKVVNSDRRRKPHGSLQMSLQAAPNNKLCIWLNQSAF